MKNYVQILLNIQEDIMNEISMCNDSNIMDDLFEKLDALENGIEAILVIDKLKGMMISE